MSPGVADVSRGIAGIAVGLLLSLGCLTPAGAATSGWIDISPPGDPLTALVAGPGPEPVLLAAHPTLGLFRSANGGDSWNSAGAQLRNPWGSTWVTALALSADGVRAAAGTRGSGLFVSDDGGKNWLPAGIGFDLSVDVITGLRFNPRNGDHILCGTNSGLFQSVDAGQSVERVRIPTAGRAPGRVMTLEFHPTDSLRAFAALDPGGLFATSDGGATWVPAGNGLLATPEILAFRSEAGAGTVALAAGPTGLARWRADLRRWAPIGYGLPDQHPLSTLLPVPDHGSQWLAGTLDGRIFASDNDGETWRHLPGPDQPGPLVLAHGARGTLLLAGGAGFFRSTDHGLSWEARDRGLPEFRTRILLADAAPSGRLHAAGAGGLRRTETFGEQWERLGSGLTPAGFTFGDLAAHPLAPDRLAGATDRGIVRSDDSGLTWWNTGLGRWTGAVAWLEPPSVGLVAVGGDSETTRAWRSTDDGATWSETTQAPCDAGAWVQCGPLGCYLAGSALRRSDDDGVTWMPLALPPAANRVTALCVPEAPRLLCGTDVGLFQSTDRGASWSPAGFAGARILGLVRGGPESRTLLLLTRDALHVSRDRAASWIRLPLSPEMGGPLALALDASERVAAVATETGLYARELPQDAAHRPNR